MGLGVERREVILAPPQGPEALSVAGRANMPVKAPGKRKKKNAVPVPSISLPEKIGHYKVLKVLGKGAFGVVFRCSHATPE